MQISKSLAALFVAIVFHVSAFALAQSAKDQAALAALAAADLKHTPAKKLFGAEKLPLNLRPAPLAAMPRAAFRAPRRCP